MLNSSKTVIRKKALLLTYRMLLRYPDALALALPRLKDRLDDKEPSVQSAACTIMTELVIRNPSIYMAFAPSLFKILSSKPPRDTWTQIKLIKCFGELTKEEPRLTQRLFEPLSHILDTSTAQSLVFEVIQAIISGMSHDQRLLRLAARKLSSFVEDSDVNIKYLGLRGLNSLQKEHSSAVRSHEEIIFKCLEEADISLRLRALDIVTGLATDKNLKSLVKRLLLLVEDEALSDVDVSGSLKSALVKSIIAMTTADDYGSVIDFEWLVGIYTRLLVSASFESQLIGETLCEIVSRVPDVRCLAVGKLVQALLSPRGAQLLETSCTAMVVGFVIGEFFDLAAKDAAIIVPKLLDVDVCKRLSGGAVGSLADAVLQIVVAEANLVKEEGDLERWQSLRLMAVEKFSILASSCSCFEGVSRSKHYFSLLEKSDDPKLIGMLSFLFRKGAELVPVSKRLNGRFNLLKGSTLIVIWTLMLKS
ncbi:hypothetical protein GEMRC1_002002 [Eukaryota sp. GEM-RC1]